MDLLEQIQEKLLEKCKEELKEEKIDVSDDALVSLLISFKKRNPIKDNNLKKELIKKKLIDNSGRITKEGKKFLKDPMVVKKIKELMN